MTLCTHLMMVRIIMDTERHAHLAAEALVRDRLAATVSVQAPHTVYREVQGELGMYQEYALLAVTTPEGFDRLCERAAGMPGVVVPGILAQRVDTAHPALEPFIRAVTDRVG